MQEPTLEQLYEAIKNHVPAVQRDRRLDDARALSETVRSQVCGSQLTLDAVIENDRVQQLGWRVRACSLGQATTAIVIKHMEDLDALTVETVGTQLRSILNGQAFHCDWPELEVFGAAREITSRHGSALLPFSALKALFERARAQDETSGRVTPGRVT